MKTPKMLKRKALGFMQNLVDKVGNELYHILFVLSNDMNISIDQLLKDYKDDYNAFWQYVTDTYNDYTKGGEEKC